MKDFKNKVVIVTGASSGIGEAMAREFAAQGARVVLGARSVQKLQLIAGDIGLHAVTEPTLPRGVHMAYDTLQIEIND